MLYVSIEAGKFTRDRARLSNLETLSKSFNFTRLPMGLIHCLANKIMSQDLLHAKLFGQIKTLYFSSTVNLDNAINALIHPIKILHNEPTLIPSECILTD